LVCFIAPLCAFFWLEGAPVARPRRKGFVPCDHEYLNFRGGKFSKSRGAAVDVPYFLSKYDPDALRFYLTAVATETRDTEFYWEDFVERNNNELVATWGNLANPRGYWGSC
jgi:methionyl-tRNA synthetase